MNASAFFMGFFGMNYIGIDGCRKGWIVAKIDENFQLELKLIQSLRELSLEEPVYSCIDIPLGLAEHSHRACDVELRKRLGKKQASVFMTPVREAVYAKDFNSAGDINQQKTGKRISLQAWNICPKIREADLFLRENPSKISCINESHPESVFQIISKDDVLESKKSEWGFQQRLRCLERSGLSTKTIQSFINQGKRNDFAVDDVLDACVLALASLWMTQFGTITFGDKALDKFGIPQCINLPNLERK